MGPYGLGHHPLLSQPEEGEADGEAATGGGGAAEEGGGGAAEEGGGGAADGGGTAASLSVPDQIRSRSWPQPDPRAQFPCSSARVHRRAPASSQMVEACAKFLLWWHLPPISSSSDSLHTEHPSFFFQPSIRESEQHRTSCFSEGAAHRSLSSHRPVLPHAT